MFFYRALSGHEVKVPLERPLYARCAVFLNLMNTRLYWGLISSAAARRQYEQACLAKGTHADLYRLAHDHFGVSLATMGFAFILLSALPLTCAWLYQVNRSALHAAVRKYLLQLSGCFPRLPQPTLL